MIDKILEQIAQLRASRPIDQRSDTGWDDLSSVRFQIAYTMEKMLAVVEATHRFRMMFGSTARQTQEGTDVDTRLHEALAALDSE